MIPVLTSEQIRQADAHTIANEPIASIDLMERAARACSDRILSWLEAGSFGYGRGSKIIVLCGPGNNGGDGAAIARHLSEAGHQVTVIRSSNEASADNREMMRRLKKYDVSIKDLQETPIDEIIGTTDVVIDALFGIGMSRSIEGKILELIRAVNSSGRPVIAIDMPSGLFTEDNGPNDQRSIINAHWTLTLEMPKLALLLPENARYSGRVEIVPIGLDRTYIDSLNASIHVIDEKDIIELLPGRDKAAHKGSFGHALLIAGSVGKAGAAALAAQASVRAGAGLVTVNVPSAVLPVVQQLVPEAMCTIGGDQWDIKHPDLKQFTAIGIGPGIGVNDDTSLLLKNLIISGEGKLVIDADGLNLLGENPTWLSFLPPGTILTPHPREFDRLSGSVASNDHERLMRAREMAMKYSCIIVLKSARTAICDPNGKIFFNVTGNPGMARGGSGDALTGLMTGLLAQRLSPLRAAILAVYLHGLAGDLCAAKRGMDGMTISELIAAIPEAWQLLRRRSQEILHGTFAYPDHFGITF